MGKPIGEVEVRLRADISKLEADLRKAEGKTKTASAKMSKSFNKMTKSVLKFAAAAVGIAAVSRVMKSLVQNAADDEAATTRLAAAMKSAGVHSDELVEKLSAQAKAHDLVSAASETELVNAQAYLLNMGVTADMMDTALLATTNLAAGLGWDLSQATLNVGKTFGGFAGELSEVIPALKGMSVSAFQAGGALKIINEKFGGQALEKISTFQGKVGEIGDAWEVFAASVGNSITKNEDALKSIDQLNKELRDERNIESMAALARGMMNVAVMAADAFGSASLSVAEFRLKLLELEETTSEGNDSFSFAAMMGPFNSDGWAGNISNVAWSWGEVLDVLGFDKASSELIVSMDEAGIEAKRAAEEQAAALASIYSSFISPTAAPEKSGGSNLTEQQLKANKDFLDKLLADKHNYDENYLASNDLRVEREMAAMGRLKLSSEEIAQATRLIEQNSADRITAIELETAEATKEIRLRSRDTYLNATGQEILAIQERRDREIAAFTEMEEKGGDWSQQKIEAAAIAQAEIADLQASEMEEWNRLFEFMEDGFNGALASMLLDGEFTFKALADSFLREFLKIGIAKTTAGIFSSLGSLFPSGGGGSVPGLEGIDTNFSGVTFAGGFLPKANGGPVGGGPILVGERGPEAFLPGVSGFVANNQTLNKMGGGGGSQVSVTVINNTGQETSTTERDGPNGDREIEVMVGKAISKNISRGGDVDQAIRNSYGINRMGRHGL
jgi:hypothetical protein